MNFDYNTSKLYRKETDGLDLEYTRLQYPTPDFTNVKDVEINMGAALVTELYDKDKDNYLYMAQNVIDPHTKYGKENQTITLTFDSKYTHAVLFEKGEKRVVKLKKGTLTLTHTAGDATFILPY